MSSLSMVLSVGKLVVYVMDVVESMMSFMMLVVCGGCEFLSFFLLKCGCSSLKYVRYGR